MNSRSLGATKVFAWPDAEVAVMDAKAAVGILHKKTLAAAPDHERDALHDQLAAEHENIAGGVDTAPSTSAWSTRRSTRRTPAARSPRRWPKHPHAAADTKTSRCS